MAQNNITGISEIFKAMGHPARIKILHLLRTLKRKKISVTQIHTRLGLTQPETSRHLIVMKRAAILDSVKEGANTYYFINNGNSFVEGIASSVGRIKL